ncbi:TPA: hypothetical protein ACH3X2_001344 [Trebouxia sp. C0005]
MGFYRCDLQQDELVEQTWNCKPHTAWSCAHQRGLPMVEIPRASSDFSSKRTAPQRWIMRDRCLLSVHS